MALAVETTPVHYLKAALILAASLHWHFATAQAGGEAGEPSPEELDAAFTSEDAAREAAAFSDAIVGNVAADPLREMADTADLVFRASVTSQSFSYDENGTPYTHTTLAIAAILKGDYPGGEISLIQEGGPAQDNDDRILMVSSSLLFNPGDEELLFVELDPDNPDPRARASVNQRYRIYEGRIYSEDGRGITLEPVAPGSGRRLALSDDRHPAAYFRQLRIGEHTLTRNFGPGAGRPGPEQADSTARPEPANMREASVARSYTDSVDVATFSDAITR